MIEAHARDPRNADEVMALYDNLFVAFNDALDGVRTDLRAALKEQTAKSGVAEMHLKQLLAGLTYQKLDHTVIDHVWVIAMFG